MNFFECVVHPKGIIICWEKEDYPEEHQNLSLTIHQ